MQVEASLKRLKTDRIDVYFIHRFDRTRRLRKRVRALDDLVHQGKIVYPAVSNWAAWQIAKALGISTYEGLARIQCLQPMYNLVKRQAEVEILPLAQAEQIGVIPYSPLGGGLLTGQVRGRTEAGRGAPGQQPDVQRRATAKRSITRSPRSSRRMRRKRAIAPATLAVAWVMAHPAVTAPIIGARNVAQLEAVAGGGGGGHDAGLARGNLGAVVRAAARD